VTNLQPDAPRVGMQRTLALLFLVVLTAVALLLGHPLERLHDAVPATADVVASVTTTDGDAPVLSSSVATTADDAGVNALAELCALLAIICVAVVAAIALAARARPGRGVPASLAPPVSLSRFLATAEPVQLAVSSGCVPLRL